MRTAILLLTTSLLPVGAVMAAQPSYERNDFALSMKELDPDILTGRQLQTAIADAEKRPLGSKENPVRADGPLGEREYISRLRCNDGSRPNVGIRASVGPGPYHTIVDAYPLTCGKDAPEILLHMDMYFRHVEDRPPSGFTMQSDLPTV